MVNPPTPPTPPAGKPKPRRPIRENIEAFAVAIVLALLLKYFGLEAYQIPTSSMQPTLMGSRAAGIFDRSTLFTAFKAALSAWLMALVLQLLPALDVVSTIAIGGVVYAVAALALRVLPREDAAHLRHALARAT